MHKYFYTKDMFNFIGIKNFNEILVDKTGFTKEEQDKAVEKGIKETRDLVSKV